MPHALVATENENTLAELLQHLGDVPPERVLLRPAPGTATADDVIWYEGSANKRLCELIDGTLVEKAMGFEHSGLTNLVAVLLTLFVREKKLGIVTTSDGMIRTESGRVRIPDVAFFSWDRLPGRRWPKEPIPRVAPNLAVEIISPSNSEAEMRMKREDYFGSGVIAVWEIDPSNRSARAFSGVDECECLTANDELHGGRAVEGFRLSLAELFAELDQKG